MSGGGHDRRDHFGSLLPRHLYEAALSTTIVGTAMSAHHEAHAGHEGHKDHSMKMYFHFAATETSVLFDFWQIGGPWSLVLSMVVVFALAVFYELVNALRLVAVRRGGTGPLEVGHVIVTVLHALQISLGYVLMLLAMTFNAWLFFAIVLGAAVGYLLFSRWRMGEADVSHTDDFQAQYGAYGNGPYAVAKGRCGQRRQVPIPVEADEKTPIAK